MNGLHCRRQSPSHSGSVVNTTRLHNSIPVPLMSLLKCLFFCLQRTPPRNRHILTALFPERMSDRCRKCFSFSDTFPHLNDSLPTHRRTTCCSSHHFLAVAFRVRSVWSPPAPNTSHFVPFLLRNPVSASHTDLFSGVAAYPLLYLGVILA